jgi:tetratricopeptide (TPR) repeat protein
MNEFLKSANVLIVSSKPSHRTSVKKLLIDNGVNNSNIEGVTDFSSAKDKISQMIIHILVTDDDIGNQGTAIDLLKLHFENNPRAHSRLSIFMPGGDSEEFINQFISLGGDLVIEKPFTSATFITPFRKIIEEKYSFTAEEMMAFDVENALTDNNKQKALEFYKTFKNQNSPSANYSIGLINMHDGDFSGAYNYFQTSLKGKFDSKVLLKLLDCGVRSKRFKELNSYIEQLIKKESFSTESATDVAKVVLYNKKFSLLENMKIQEDQSKIPLAAGLVVASSVYLDRGDVHRSIEYALRAIEHSSNKPSIVLRAMEILLQAGGVDKAQKVLVDLKQDLAARADLELIKNLENLLAAN